MMKFDASKFKKKQEEEKLRQEEARKNGGGKYAKKTIQESQIVKVDKGGEHYFRAFPYIHNADYESDPFADRTYHFGIPGVGNLYCPQVNSGRREKCAVCDFVWEQMKANKGVKSETDKWKQFLPKRRILIPGILRGREKEGIKFFSLSTNNDKNSANHDQLIKWLTKESTCDFLHPVTGFDMILNYEEYDKAKSDALNGAQFGFSKFELDRDRTKISDDPEAFWENVEKNLIDVDVDLEGFEKKSYEDSVKALETWVAALERKSKSVVRPAVKESKDDDGSSSKTSLKSKRVEEEDESTDVQVDPDELPVKASSEDSSKMDRRARVKSLLAKPSLT
jgi:hypothetical protein